MPVSIDTLDALWDFADPAASEARLRAAAADAHDDADRAELATQVARALGLQERFAEGDAVLDAITSDVPAVTARVLLERGRLRNSEGDADAARAFFLRSADAAASEDLLFLRVDALHMLAICDAERGDEWTREALTLLDGTSDPRTLRWNVALHNNAGWAHLDAQQYAEAVSSFEAARAAAVKWGTPQHVAWADEALAEARSASRLAPHDETGDPAEPGR